MGTKLARVPSTTNWSGEMAKRSLAIFEREARPADHFGSLDGEWVEVCRARLELIPIGGREAIEGQRTTSQTTHEARMLYTSATASVGADCRMRIGARMFHVVSVLNHKEANREIHMGLIERT